MSDAEILPFPDDGDTFVRDGENVRIAEALIFASASPITEADLGERLQPDADVPAVLERLRAIYAGRGVALVKVAGGWTFRTADDLAFLLRAERQERRKLSKAALEVLAIIAYHQPVTRAEIEGVRGVATSRGTLDTLLELDWVRMRGRRRSPGRPVTYGVTAAFLEHFGLDTLSDLPGLEELRGAGLLQPDMPETFAMPDIDDAEDGDAEEDPFTAEDLEELGILSPGGAER